MDGIINVYKERGYTSHDVVAKLRGILHQKKIGHTGTLDPDAEGVLPVCLGKATKVCDLLTDWDKEYCATLVLGVSTDTQDMTGTILNRCPVFLHDTTLQQGARYLTEDEIRRCVSQFIGEIQQIPPMYSALKVNGKKLYELARQGIEVERKPRTIRIHSIQLETIREKEPVIEIQMRVNCSKGTYIRTLCNDIGQALSCGGCMSSLLRTKVGPFLLTDAKRLDEISDLRDQDRLKECLYPVDCIFANLAAVRLTAEAEKLVRNGNPLSRELMAACPAFEDTVEPFFVRNSLKERDDSKVQYENETVQRRRLYGQDGAFLAVYEYREDKNSWRARKMFLS